MGLEKAGSVSLLFLFLLKMHQVISEQLLIFTRHILEELSANNSSEFDFININNCYETDLGRIINCYETDLRGINCSDTDLIPRSVS